MYLALLLCRKIQQDWLQKIVSWNCGCSPWSSKLNYGMVCIHNHNCLLSLAFWTSVFGTCFDCWSKLILLFLTDIFNGVTALHEALRDEVQRLKLATGEISNGSGQNLSLGGQHVFQVQNQTLNAQQIQQLQQAQTALNNQQQQQQSSQQQMHSDYMQRSGYGLSSGFMKAEGSTIAINHGSSASFGWFLLWMQQVTITEVLVRPFSNFCLSFVVPGRLMVHHLVSPNGFDLSRILTLCFSLLHSVL